MFDLEDSKEKVAIVGIGLRYPGNSNDPNSFFNNLLNKKDCIVDSSSRFSKKYFLNELFSNNNAGLVDIKEWQSFDPLFFGLTPSEASTIDPSQRLLLKCTWEALEDGKIDPFAIRGTNTTVYVGISTGEYQLNTIPQYDPIKNLFGTTSHSLSNRISYCFDFRGESLSIDTGCSSSLNSFNLGYNSILSGKTDISVIGGYNFLMNPFYTKGLSALEMLSKSGKCYSFDERADGYVRGEGCGVVVLKRLSLAIKDSNRIYCIVGGANSNVDGFNNKTNLYSPSSNSQIENIEMAFKSTNGLIQPSNIDFFECHGTSTPTGDPVETKSLSKVFKRNHSKENPLLIGSIKPNIGHLEGGSGIASLIKCCLMFKFRRFLPNINFEKGNKKIKFDKWNIKVLTDPLNFPNNKLVTIMMNNFGITGSNSCAILREFKQQQNNEIVKLEEDFNKTYLIPISSNSKKSLHNYILSIVDNIEFYKNNFTFIDFINYQINSKSLKLNQRIMIKAKNWEDFINKNNSIETDHSKISNISIKLKKQNIIFLFSGQGSQYNTMGSYLYESNQIFRYWIDIIDNKFESYYGFSIWEKLKSFNQNEVTVNEPLFAQPSIGMLQIALFELYKSWGIYPTITLGHSLGETTAQYCSGYIDLDTFCKIIYNRSMSQQKTIDLNQRMLSININKNDFLKNYSREYPSLEIACINSPNSIVIGGDEEILKNLQNQLNIKNIFNVFLSTKSSFHTSSQNIIKHDILNCKFKTLDPVNKIPVFSTVYGKEFNEEIIYDPNYSFENIRNPVKFSKAIKNIFKYIENNNLTNNIVFIELSPHPTLLYYIKEMLPKDNQYFNKDSILILSSLNKKLNDEVEINNLISKLYCFGYNNINFNQQFNNLKTNVLIDLPSYKWENEKFLYEDEYHYKNRIDGPPIDILGNENYNTPIKSFISYINISKPIYSYLKGHLVPEGYFFPGFGYIENVLKIFQDTDIVIDNIEFKVPLIFKKGENIMLHTNVSEINSIKNKIQFHYFNPKSEKWIEVSSVDVYLKEFDYNNLNLQLSIQDIIENECNYSKVNQNELYSFIKSNTNVKYSSNFIGVKECYFGKNSYVSIIPINLPNSDIKEMNHQLINCIVLDCCLHGLFGLIKDRCQLFLDKLENFKLYSYNLVDIKDIEFLYCYGKINYIHQNSYYCTFKIICPDGTVLIDVENIVLTSSFEIKDSLILEYEPNFYYEYFLENINSIIKYPNSHQQTYNDNKISYIKEFENLKYYIVNIFYNNILEKSNISLQNLKDLTIEQLAIQFLKEKKNEKLFKYGIGLLKNNINYINVNQNYKMDVENIDFMDFINKSLKILANIISPNDNHNLKIDYPESLSYDSWLSLFYKNNSYFNVLFNNIKEVIENSIKENINKKNVIRILEINGGYGNLTGIVLNSINSLLESNPMYEVDIEYTYSHFNTSQFAQVKENNKFKGSLLFKSLNFEEFNKNDIKPNYYDFIISSNHLHFEKSIEQVINEIYKSLKNNGQFLLLEFKDHLINNISFGIFDEWWENNSFENYNCCLNKNQWEDLLRKNNFSDLLYVENEVGLTIQARKNEDEYNENTYTITKDNCISFTFTNDNRSFKTLQLIDQLNINYKNNQIIDNFNLLLKSIKEDSVVYFIKTIENLNLNNFKQVTLEYIKLNQYLIKNKLNQVKLVLITFNTFGTSENYLNGSILGTFRYFIEDQDQDLKLYCFDLDLISLNNINLIPKINSLMNENKFIQTEYIFRNDEVYFEKMKKIKNSLLKYTKENSKSIDKNKYISRYNFKLNFELILKEKLKSDQVEVEIKSIGLDYKDYLIYVKKKVYNNKINSFGCEFSGIIKNVGEQVKDYSIGDKVYGYTTNSCQSSIIINSNEIEKIPEGLSFNESASIPSFIKCYYYLFYMGNLHLDDNQSILISSISLDLIISLLNILKWKDFINNNIKIILDSNEKKNFILKEYKNQFRNLEIYNNIYDIKEFNEKESFDLIIFNSNDDLTYSLKLLNHGGKFIDLNINEIDNKEQLEIKLNLNGNYMKFVNISYKISKNILSKVTKAINEKKLKLIPISIYENNQRDIKNALIEINKRNKAGKVIIDFSKNDILTNAISNLNDKQVVEYKIREDKIGKTILITGQTGIALEIVKWIVKYSNVENIIVLSKSEMKWELKNLIKSTNELKPNIKFYFKSLDISNMNDLNEYINKLFKENNNISNVESIFHYAFIQVVNEPLDISMNDLDLSHDAKTIGAINLHNLSLELKWPIKNFIIASSTAAKFGSFNQCSYVSSLCAIDSLTRYRRSMGLPSISINMGSILSVGIAAKSDTILKMLESQGINHITTNQLFGSMDIIINNQDLIDSNFIIYNVDFNIVQNKKYTYPIIDYYLNPLQNKTINQNNNSKFKDEDEKIINKIGELLEFEPSKINQEITLLEYGIDSLLTVQLRNFFSKEYYTNIVTVDQIQNLTIINLINLIKKYLSNQKK